MIGGGAGAIRCCRRRRPAWVFPGAASAAGLSLLIIPRAPTRRRTGDDPSPVPVCLVKEESLMPSNREIVTEAFTAWSAGTGHVTGIFADDMT